MPAVGDDAQWPGVLDRISELVGVEQTFLLTDRHDPKMPSAIASGGTDPEALRLFLDYYSSINVFAEPADRTFRAGETRFSHWVVADSDLERTEFYQDFFRRFGMYYSFGVKIAMPEERSLYLSCQRSKNKSSFTQDEGHILQSLRPHLQRAFQLQQQMVAARDERDGLLASIGAFGHAVFGLDRAGRVTFCTEQAKQAVRMASVLEVREGRLRCVLQGQGEMMQKMVESLGKSDGAKMVSKTLSRANGDPMQVTVSGLPDSSGTLVYFYDPAMTPPSRTQVLVDLFRMTPIESRLCQALLCGLNVQDAADMLRITPSTCRFHLKSIFTKTGVRRQPELLLLLSSLPAM
jgi:DNA-binding CsgD family transcriptional regulator